MRQNKEIESMIVSIETIMLWCPRRVISTARGADETLSAADDLTSKRAKIPHELRKAPSGQSS
jgi:hypothetical protein